MRWITAHREQRKREEKERIDQVVVEFDADPRTMAAAILEYRRAAMQLADATRGAARARSASRTRNGTNLNGGSLRLKVNTTSFARTWPGSHARRHEASRA
jgi:hypothetical protein